MEIKEGDYIVYPRFNYYTYSFSNQKVYGLVSAVSGTHVDCKYIIGDGDSNIEEDDIFYDGEVDSNCIEGIRVVPESSELHKLLSIIFREIDRKSEAEDKLMAIDSIINPSFLKK